MGPRPSRRLTRVAKYLLKLEFQPEKKPRAWVSTIRVQAREVAKIVEQSPSLRRELPDFIAKAYAYARKDAFSEMEGVPIVGSRKFPPTPTPTFERALAAALAGDYFEF